MSDSVEVTPKKYKKLRKIHNLLRKRLQIVER